MACSPRRGSGGGGHGLGVVMSCGGWIKRKERFSVEDTKLETDLLQEQALYIMIILGPYNFI